MRMVACDLDGTIVRSDGTVSPRTLAAFDACLDVGVQVVFVSGRPPRWMAPIAEVTGHRGLALCGNGAAVLRLDTMRVVEAHGFEPAEVTQVVTRLGEHLPGAVFALETLTGFRREPDFTARDPLAGEVPHGSVPELLADGATVIKVLVRQVPAAGDSDAMLAVARRVLDGLAEPVHSGAGAMIEIAAPGVNKASGLARLAGKLGIAADDVVAFGDMPNDVPMLRWAGRGYAMSGGHVEASRATAGRLAPPCDDDGVAQVLEELLAASSARSGSG